METRQDLEEVRTALRSLGYLNHGFERYLLQDAVRGRRPFQTLLALTGKVAVPLGAVLALGLTLLLAAANGSFNTPFDLPVLFLHLALPIMMVSAGAFLALCGVVVIVLRLYPVRRLEALSLAAASVVGAIALVGALWLARGALAESGRWALAAAALLLPLAAYLVVKFLHGGLLALAIRFTDRAPERRLLRGRWLAAGLLATLFLFLLPVMLSARKVAAPPPEALPTAPGERVLLIGVDGVLPEELEYLLRAQALPHLSRLLASGGQLLPTRRPEEQPATFWTSVATGATPAQHGVVALDSVLPVGVRTPLARTGLLRAYFRGVELPLGLAEDRPLLAGRRLAFTVWELAARGGAPVLAVDWWATFPAAPVPGTVIAHDAYHLLGSGTGGAVSPAAAVPGLKAAMAVSAASAADRESERVVLSSLDPAAAVSLIGRAIRPDSFYREVFRARLAARPRAGALYLAGLDIAAAGWRGNALAWSDLVRLQLGAADRLVGEAMLRDEPGTVAIVFDAGRRRDGGPGRVLLWRAGGCAGRTEAVTPEAIATGLLRALGLPQSAELPPPPPSCSWSPPPASVAGFGAPQVRQGASQQGAEYLQSLKSLGYL